MGRVKTRKLSKSFVALILSAVMSISMVQVVFAEDMIGYETSSVVDYTDSNVSFENEVFDWDYETLTLTLKENISLLVHDTEYGLTLPADATLVINGQLGFENVDFCIDGLGDLTIIGGYIYATENTYCPIAVEGALILDNVMALLQGTTYAYTAGGVSITNSTIVSNTQWQSFAVNGDTLIENSYIALEGCFYIYDSTIEIINSVVSTSSYICCGGYSIDEVSSVDALMSIETIEIVDGVESYSYEETIYGDYVCNSEGVFYEGDLYFAEGSSLNVNEGVTVDLTYYYIHGDNINVVGEGNVIWPESYTPTSDTDIDATETETEPVPEPETEPETVPEIPTETDLVAQPTSSTVLVDGENISFDAYEILDNNYFKLRDVAYVLSGSSTQFEVIWNEELQSIELISNSAYTPVTGEMIAGDGTTKTPKATTSTIYLDGVEVALTAYEINGNNYFKLRDLGELFDFNVSWDGTQNTIVVASDESYTAD